VTVEQWTAEGVFGKRAQRALAVFAKFHKYEHSPSRKPASVRRIGDE